MFDAFIETIAAIEGWTEDGYFEWVLKAFFDMADACGETAVDFINNSAMHPEKWAITGGSLTRCPLNADTTITT